jgi:hypothetical protein
LCRAHREARKLQRVGQKPHLGRPNSQSAASDRHSRAQTDTDRNRKILQLEASDDVKDARTQTDFTSEERQILQLEASDDVKDVKTQTDFTSGKKHILQLKRC